MWPTRQLPYSRRQDPELADEILAHIEERAEDLIACGTSEREARLQARREFGNPTLYTELSREAWGWNTLDHLLLDVRYTWQRMRRDLPFTLLAILTLGLGMAAAASIFSMVETVLIRPLPIRDPSRVAIVWAADRLYGQQMEVSYRDFTEFQKRSKLFEQFALASAENDPSTLMLATGAQPIESVIVSGGLFPMLGVNAQLGRVFTEADGASNAPPIGMISHHLWQTQFGGDRGIVGKTVTADGHAYTIVGVMPADFDFPRNTDLWRMAETQNLAKWSSDRMFQVVGRLKPGATLEQARLELDDISKSLEKEFPVEDDSMTVRVDSLHQTWFGNSRPALWILLGAAALVLLLSCLNVGNLVLSRALSQQRETRIRMALGATRAHLVRMVLTNSVLMALAGGLIGAVLLRFAMSALVAIAPRDVPRITEAGASGSAMLCCAALSLVVAILIGLPAVLHVLLGHAAPLLPTGFRGNGWRSQSAVRRFFVVAQVAVSAMLLIASTSLTRAFFTLDGIHPGFDADHLLSFRIHLTSPAYETRPARTQFFDHLLNELRRLPDVRSASAVLLRPLSGALGWDSIYTIEGQTAETQRRNPIANLEVVSADYFQTMNIPILQGEPFPKAQQPGARYPAMVNAAFAARFWPGENPIGKRIKMMLPAKEGPWLTVTGVTGDARYRQWQTAGIELYVPLFLLAQPQSDFVVRTSVDPEQLKARIPKLVASIDKDQPVGSLTTVEALVSDTLARPRFNMILGAIFAIWAFALAMSGVFGILMYSVGQRSSEMGVRLALGAGRGNVLRLVIGEGLWLTCGGLLIGIFLAWASRGVIAELLYGVRMMHPSSLAAICALVIVVSALASYLPARRATCVDPAIVLKHD